LSRRRKSKNEGPLFGPLVFNAYKPVGMTSSDVVRHFKYHLPKGFGKIGHFGTLDPFAEGVLLIAIGQAPRFNDHVHSTYPKTYLATGLLGVESPTGDFTVSENELVEHPVSNFTKEELLKIIDTFKGKYLQSPAVFSATKHEGKTLYEWAREGIKIEKPPVEREVFDISLVSFDKNKVAIRTTVSSGTYIRVLFDDIAKKLGTRGTLQELVRESIGPANVDTALLKDQWPLRESDFDVYETSDSIDKFLQFPHIHLTDSQAKKFRNGMTLDIDSKDGQYWVYCDEQLLGYAILEQNKLRVKVGLFAELLKKN
jgi:tRNA pseudouridine55 synthase